MEDESIFRQEALDHYLRGQGPGDVLRLSPIWTTWLFWIVLGAFLAALIVLSTATISERVIGPALIRDGRLVAAFPAQYASALQLGETITVEAADGSSFEAEIESVSSDRSGDDLVEAGLPVGDIAGPVVIVGAIVPDAVGGQDPEQVAAAIRVKERILFALVPGLRSLFGSSDA